MPDRHLFEDVMAAMRAASEPNFLNCEAVEDIQEIYAHYRTDDEGPTEGDGQGRLSFGPKDRGEAGLPHLWDAQIAPRLTGERQRQAAVALICRICRKMDEENSRERERFIELANHLFAEELEIKLDLA